MEERTCKKCGVTFYAKRSLVARGWGLYCSRACHYADSAPMVVMQCAFCGGEVHRKPSKLEHSKSGKYFCNKSCQTKWRNTVFVGAKHRQWKGGASVDYRSILQSAGLVERCVMCRTSDTRVLAVHHLDGNHKNNALDNLVWLCHNCHHMTHYTKGGVQKLRENMSCA